MCLTPSKRSSFPNPASYGSPRPYSSIILDALLQTNHTALLRPHISNQIRNQCSYLLLYVPKTLLKKSARLSDWQRLGAWSGVIGIHLPEEVGIDHNTIIDSQPYKVSVVHV